MIRLELTADTSAELHSQLRGILRSKPARNTYGIGREALIAELSAIIAAAQSNNRIQAIKAIRSITGMTLVESKNLVEQVMR
jgi:ribosomal protein L7/L12